MDNLWTQTLVFSRKLRAIALENDSQTLPTDRFVGKQKRATKYLGLAVVAVSFGSFQLHTVSAQDGCASCASSCCTTCDATCQPFKIPGLGAGLLDCLDKATNRLEANFSRLHGSPCSCSNASMGNDRSCQCSNCTSSPSCDSFNGDLELSDYAASEIGSHPSVVESHGSVLSNAPSLDARRLQLDPRASQKQSDASLVPAPIPEPSAMQPLNPRRTMPTNQKLGDPFLDEARFVPKFGEAPTALATNRSSRRSVLSNEPPSLTEPSRSRENGMGNEVITAGSVQVPSASEVRFAR